MQVLRHKLLILKNINQIIEIRNYKISIIIIWYLNLKEEISNGKGKI